MCVQLNLNKLLCVYTYVCGYAKIWKTSNFSNYMLKYNEILHACSIAMRRAYEALKMEARAL